MRVELGIKVGINNSQPSIKKGAFPKESAFYIYSAFAQRTLLFGFQVCSGTNLDE